MIYTPRVTPGPPTPARQLAYHNHRAIPGPISDPKGWLITAPMQCPGNLRGIEDVMISGTVSLPSCPPSPFLKLTHKSRCFFLRRYDLSRVWRFCIETHLAIVGNVYPGHGSAVQNTCEHDDDAEYQRQGPRDYASMSTYNVSGSQSGSEETS